ncbi:tyrosine-type recombinase/integrase [Tissierella sp. MSJ-40]|uniref:Tyrosine-type recombinase/integrase n=1 Tax=Tissierella simiarum TaxID=2841534 RepID=A0ABS6ECT9_9FIRM|nr:tyrosine-type recombinase/integrase [Tissierella simiarum]
MDLNWYSLEKVGIRKLTPYSARHTFASLLNKAGADKVYIQKLIGHSDYSTTTNIYTHLEMEELKKAIEMI